MMQLRSALLVGFCIGLASPQAGARDALELVYIGTQGSAGPQQEGSAPQGIYAARLDAKTGRLSPLGLTVGLPRATTLLRHPTLPVIYSSAADSAGGRAVDSILYCFEVDAESGNLRAINKVDAGGRDATALALDLPSNILFSANHGSGNITMLPVHSDGSLGPVTSEVKNYCIGEDSRQQTPKTHGVVVDPTHKYVLVTVFGADRIFIYHFNGASRVLTPAQPPAEPVPVGSGPRHLVFHPTGKFLFVDTQLTAELRSYRWDAKAGRLHLLQTLSPYPAGDHAEKDAAEIVVSRDGRFVYLSLRDEQDSVVVYAFDAHTGTLTEIQRISAQGKTPWSFGIDPTGHWMLVTNEASDTVAVLRVDPATGRLSATGESIPIPNPVAIAFYLK
jgi:6-phosphogluconolactonase